METEFGHHAFSTAAPQIWNQMPLATIAQQFQTPP